MKKIIGLSVALVFFLTIVVGINLLTSHLENFVEIKSDTELKLPLTVEIISLYDDKERVFLYSSETITNEKIQIDTDSISQSPRFLKLSIGETEHIISEYIEAASNKFQIVINIESNGRKNIKVKTRVKTLLGDQTKELIF